MQRVLVAIILVSLMAAAPIQTVHAQGGGGGSGGGSGSGAGGGAANSGAAGSAAGTGSEGNAGGAAPAANNASGAGSGSTNTGPVRLSPDHPAAGLENAPTTGGVIGGTTGVPPKGVEPTASQASKSDKPVKTSPCTTSARETDGTTTCIGTPGR